jgi:plastocyanin
MLSVGLFGGAVAVLPGLAAATNPTVTATDFKYTPTQVAVTPGGSVDFANGGGNHDVHFTGSMLPSSCTTMSPNQIGPSAANPTATVAGSTNSWMGTCMFSQSGTYSFECSVHHFTGTVYVNNSGTVPTTTTTPTTTPTTPTTTTTGTTPTTTTPGYTTPTGGGGTTPTGTGPGPSGGGSAAARSLQLPAGQRGTAVKGAVTIASGGSDFEADLLGNTSQLARSVLVGKTAKHGVRAGKLSFKVSLDKRGRAALKRHGRLSLKLVVKVNGASGEPTSLSRPITLRS